MKRLFIWIFFFYLTPVLHAQAPQTINFQTVLRDSSNNLLVNRTVQMRIGILVGSATGTVVYSEAHNPFTNANGLVTIEVGGGVSSTGTFSSINWGSGVYFLKTETDPNNGSDFTIVSTTQMLGVSYALYADKASEIEPTTATQGQRLTYCNGKAIWTTGGICPSPDPVTDASGNSYPTVVIGTQIWMAENLRTTKYSDGTDIPVISDNAIWANDAAEPKMCWFNNNATTYTENKFGALYNWYVIDPSTNGNKNVCPSGWHVPDENEWNILIAYLDPFSDPTATGAQSAVAGGKMKSTGTLYWLDPNTDATNASGFSALPGGLRGGDAVFFNAFSKGFWWSSSESTSALAWMRRLDNDNANVNRFEFSKDSGCSVRCIKDATP
jgi:uncharacterized protein (TIGR02145 family)